MTWYKPSEKKPVQGKKALCMHKGDLYVAQRFKDYWFSIPFGDSCYSRYFEPELWQEIDFPPPLTGMMLFVVNDGEKITADELENECLEAFNDFVKGVKASFDEYIDKKFQKKLLKKEE